MGYTTLGNYFCVTCCGTHVVGVVNLGHVEEKKNHFSLVTSYGETFVQFRISKKGNNFLTLTLPFFTPPSPNFFYP